MTHVYACAHVCVCACVREDRDSTDKRVVLIPSICVDE